MRVGEARGPGSGVAVHVAVESLIELGASLEHVRMPATGSRNTPGSCEGEGIMVLGRSMEAKRRERAQACLPREGAPCALCLGNR